MRLARLSDQLFAKFRMRDFDQRQRPFLPNSVTT
jgi:hypothetical protein